MEHRTVRGPVGTAAGPRLAFRLLGPMEVWLDGVRIDLHGSKPRTVLAALLLARGRVVTDSTLVTLLWGEAPPNTAQAQIHTYASRLRGVLGSVARIEREGPGYRLDVVAAELDVADFARLAAEGRRLLHDGHVVQAAQRLTEALALWRGPALGGVTEFYADGEQPGLEQTRLAAIEDRIDADLALGRHACLVGELATLIVAHPLRERLRAQLMRAHYQAGRRADALLAYRQCRQAFATELGIEPSHELRDLHRSILAGDAPVTAQPVAAKPVADPHPLAGARQQLVLPSEPIDFVGRAAEADRACALLGAPPRLDAPPPVFVILGTAGAGKTTLARHVARRLRGTFDAQVQVELGGSDGRPRDPGAALIDLLRALGVEHPFDAADTEELTWLYRARLAGRRMLILLDGAVDEQQVRRLLPVTPGCGTLITSRRRLTALEGVHSMELGPLPAPDAARLLDTIVGSARTAQGGGAAVQDILDACGRLPLAIRICAARLAARPHWTLARLAARLADRQRMLDELRIADLDMRASLAPSYLRLHLDARRAFRLLSLYNAADIPTWTAAVLLDLPLGPAQDVLEELVDEHLLAVAGTDPDRYRFPPLVWAYARERLQAEETPGERANALLRFAALGA